MKRAGQTVFVLLLALVMALSGCKANPASAGATAAPTIAVAVQPTPAQTPVITPMPPPTPAPTPRPAPTLTPATAPGGTLLSITLDTAMAVIGVCGKDGGKEATKFYDLPGAPELSDTAWGAFRNQLVLPAAQVFHAMGAEVTSEEAGALSVKLGQDTYVYTVGQATYQKNGASMPAPKGASPALYKAEAVWLPESLFPFPEAFARVQDGTVFTLDFSVKNDSAGRQQALARSRSMWSEYPK